MIAEIGIGASSVLIRITVLTALSPSAHLPSIPEFDRIPLPSAPPITSEQANKANKQITSSPHVLEPNVIKANLIFGIIVDGGTPNNSTKNQLLEFSAPPQDPKFSLGTGT